MKIKARVRLEWQDWNMDTCLNMIVYFKYPNRILPVRIKKRILTVWQIGEGKNYPFKDRDEFQKAVIELLNDREELEDWARYMIVNHYKTKTKQTKEDIFVKNVRQLIDKTNEGFEIEIEIKE